MAQLCQGPEYESVCAADWACCVATGDYGGHVEAVNGGVFSVADRREEEAAASRVAP